MNYRKPTASDIGKTVEMRGRDDSPWIAAKLKSIEIEIDESNAIVWWFWTDEGICWGPNCRVPYSCPDPIAELSILADELAESGHDEAARVLMAEIERLQKSQEDSEQYGGLLISQLPVDSVKTRHDGWFYVHDTESDYLRKDGRFHATCGNEGFYATREEARQAIDEYLESQAKAEEEHRMQLESEYRSQPNPEPQT